MIRIPRKANLAATPNLQKYRASYDPVFAYHDLRVALVGGARRQTVCSHTAKYSPFAEIACAGSL
jgi:hypothetical protein